MPKRLKCPNCNVSQDWDIKLGKNWFIRCYSCESTFDLEREKRPKQKRKTKQKKHKGFIKWVSR